MSTFRKLSAWTAGELRKSPGSLWHFVKKIPRWLYQGAIVSCWLTLYLLSGADQWIRHPWMIAAARFLVAALGLFVVLALLGFVEGTSRKLLVLLRPFLYLFGLTAFLEAWSGRIHNWALREFTRMTLLMLAIPLVLWFGKFWSLSAPIHWWLLGACVLLLACTYLREQSRPSQRIIVAEAVRAALLPVAFGVALVCWLQVVFNLYDRDVLSIRLFENHIGYLSAQSERWFDFSLPASISLTISLVLLSFVVPRWKPVTQASRAKTFLHAVTALLACVSSFTFLAQAPFKIQDHQEAMRLQAQRKSEGPQGDLRRVVIESMQHALETMPPEQREACRQGLREMLSKLSELAPYREHGRILEAIAQRTIEAAVTDSSHSSGSHSPENGSDKQVHADTAPPKLAQAELLTGLGSMFSDLLGAATPELEGMLGKFVEALVDKESDHFYEERVRPGLETRLADLKPAASSLTTAALLRQFVRGPHADKSIDLAKESSAVEQTIMQEEERARSQSEQEEGKPDILIEP